MHVFPHTAETTSLPPPPNNNMLLAPLACAQSQNWRRTTAVWARWSKASQSEWLRFYASGFGLWGHFHSKVPLDPSLAVSWIHTCWLTPKLLTYNGSVSLVTTSLTAGSNTHNNKPPGGDGQTGDAGEGRGGKVKVIYMIIIGPMVVNPTTWYMEHRGNWGSPPALLSEGGGKHLTYTFSRSNK